MCICTYIRMYKISIIMHTNEVHQICIYSTTYIQVHNKLIYALHTYVCSSIILFEWSVRTCVSHTRWTSCAALLPELSATCKWDFACSAHKLDFVLSWNLCTLHANHKYFEHSAHESDFMHAACEWLAC